MLTELQAFRGKTTSSQFVRLVCTSLVSGLLFQSATADDAERAQLTGEQIRELTQSGVSNAIARFRDFLSLPNDANYPDDIQRLVEWLEPQFRSLGFETERLPTAGNPVLFAERAVAGASRTVLVYLQADGQPVDASAWAQDDPFGPVLKAEDDGDRWNIIPWSSLENAIDPNWRIFARSASDSKGPMIQFMTAIGLLNRANIATAFNLKVIIDTEEEMGSPHLAALVEANRDLMSADMLLIFDGPPHASGQPTVSFGARGMTAVTLTSYGPKVPQHSGHYGNFVPNPAFHLARILSSMKSEDGKVLIDGFYDGVELDDDVLAILAAVPDDERAILDSMGVASADRVAPSLQQALQYPSLNIRGLASAWVGSETRTIIPATATAEIDIRLVKESDPAHLVTLLRLHIERMGYTVLDHDPTDDERLRHTRMVKMTSDTNYAAFRADFDSAAGQLARGGMLVLYGEEPILIRTMGGSIPISPFVEMLQLPAAIVPTVNIDNNQHSPNENIRLGNFIEGISIILAVLTQIPE